MSAFGSGGRNLLIATSMPATIWADDVQAQNVADLRYVSRLPDPKVKAFVELGGRIEWNLSDRVNLALAGFNLLHERHQEFPAPSSNAVSRTFFIEMKWRP